MGFSPFHQPVLQGVSLPVEAQDGGLILGREGRAGLGREGWALIQDSRGGRTSIQLHHLLPHNTQLLLLKKDAKKNSGYSNINIIQRLTVID